MFIWRLKAKLPADSQDQEAMGVPILEAFLML